MVEGRSRELRKDRGGGWDRLQAAYRYGGRGAAGAGVGGGEDLAGSRDAHRKRRGRGLSLREGHGDWGCE